MNSDVKELRPVRVKGNSMTKANGITSGVRIEMGISGGIKDASLIILRRRMVDCAGVTWRESIEEFEDRIGAQAFGIESNTNHNEVRTC